ncbi:MAG: membrane protein insertase YidC [Candidatus Babeliales bacterium]
MNIKELVVIVCLALLTTWGIEYFLFNKKGDKSTGLQSGQSFVVPKEQHSDVLKQLLFDVDLVKTKKVTTPVITEVDTPLMRASFSSNGAVLERLEFKKELGGVPREISTIFPLVSDGNPEKLCFLVALEKHTPWEYTLVSHTDTVETHEITYTAHTHEATLTKTFTVFKEQYKIGLTLTVSPHHGSAVQARIFIPTPIMPDIASTDTKAGIISEERNTITKIQLSRLTSDKAWFAPTLVGLDNRYFAHALIQDPAQFTQRAYFKVFSPQDTVAIVEGPVVNQEQAWSLSFYMGPKEEKVMRVVDPRLEHTLDYAGWLAPISNLLLKLLTFLYGYVYNYGLAIIILTLLIKLLLLPFTLKGAKSMKKMSEMQRKLQYIQNKYKDDQEQLNRERAELLRQQGMPGLSGCLPLLLQIPIFIALSRVLSSAIELYQAPFGLWIKDLSQADPYYILPILIALTMLVQAATMDAKQRTQFIVMACVFGALSINFSTGLCLYIFVSTVLGVLQTAIQHKLKVA